MNTGAGRVPMRFSDGKVRFIPAGKVDSVKAAFPDAVVEKLRPANPISGLSRQDAYTSPGRSVELAGQGAQATHRLLADNLPGILATAATLPLGGIGGIAGPALRTGAASTAMFGGSALGDVVMGQPPNLEDAAKSFGAGMVLGPASELVAGGAGAARHKLTKGAFRPTEKMLERSPTLIDDLMSAGVKIRKPGEPAAEAIRAKKTSMAKTRRMVTGTTGSISVDDALGQVRALRNEIARFAPTDDRLPIIDTYINEFVSKWGSGRVPLSAAHRMKISAQREASSKFAREGGSPATSQELNKLVAQDVRLAIGRELPSRAGRAGYNKQDEITQRAHQMKKAAERAPRLSRHAEIPTHAIATTVGGLGGYGAHGPYGGAGGVIGLNLLVAALENPYIANRLALAMRSPAGSSAIRSAPLFAEPLVSPLMPQVGKRKEP